MVTTPPEPDRQDPSADSRSGLPKRLRKTTSAQEPQPARAVGRSRPERAEKALEFARACARIAEDNRGKDVVILDLRAVTPLVDFFVIATALSRRQASAIASETDAEMKRLGETKLGIEGAEEGRWILIDYGDIVVHVFSEDAREYYGIEDLWGDALKIDGSGTTTPESEMPTPDTPEAG